MKFQQIPVDKITVPPVRVTAVYDEEQLSILRETLKAMGQIQPCVVVQIGDNYEIVDGLHRLNEARDRADQKIPCVVYEGDAASSLIMNLVLNKVRGKTKASEMVSVIEILWKDHNLDSEAIAARTGLSRDYIERLQVISQASPSVRQALDAEVIGVGHAYQLARIPRPLIQDEIIAKQQLWRWTVAELKDQVDAILEQMELIKKAPPQQSGPALPPPPRPKCGGCQKEVEPQYLRPVMICPDCFGQVWRLAKAATEAVEVSLDKG